jgi:hypothetical protein
MGRFEWAVAKGGYQWCEVSPLENLEGGQPGAARVRVLTPKYTLTWHRYGPLEDTPVLYRTFADVEATEAGIQSFANQYGLLGLWKPFSLDETQPGLSVQGEPLAAWQGRILAMRNTLKVWDVLRRRDQETLQHWVTQKEHGDFLRYIVSPDAPLYGGQPFFEEPRLPDGMLSLALRESESYIVKPPVPRNVEGFAITWLRAQINKRITTYVTPYVGYAQESDTDIPLAMQTMPKHLYGALWLELALNVRGTEWDQQCWQCGTWFRVPAKARRSSTAYCSTRCRVKAARQRQTHTTPAQRGT